MSWVKLLEKNRTLVILFFCLPASFIFNLLLQIKRYVHRNVFSSPEKHDSKVRKIQEDVKKWRKLPENKRKLLCTARPNWLSLSTTFFNKNECHKINVDLFNVLGFNEEKMEVRVEPMVTVGEITDFLIPKGYTLAVTLEMKDATLGGLAMATGMTTYSHKVGLYQENVISYEVVLGDGSLIKATKEEHSDLYKALPWSHGSLGLLVALTLKVVKIKPFVSLSYIPVFGQKEYCDKIRKLSGAINKNDKVPDFIEATIFNKEEAVITVGNYSNFDSTIPFNEITAWYKPWFYKYVETFLEKGQQTELIPLQQYLLRHNRAIFWVVESMIPIGNNPLFRLLFGWLLPPKPAFLKFTTTPGIRAYTFTKQVFQDIVLPIQELEKQINISEELFDTYPLLVYPCKIYDHGPNSGQLKRPHPKYIVPGTNYAMYNDLGIYGVPGNVKKGISYNPVIAMRKMEKFTRDIGGFSFLYADTFMSPGEFEEMFDLSLYENVREEYKAKGAFPSLYNKIKPEIDVYSIGNTQYN